LLIVCGAPRAGAAIVGNYFDAIGLGGSANTTPSSAFAPSYANNFGDNLWDDRPNVGLDSAGNPGTGSGNNVLEAGPSATEPTTPTITTTRTGLPSDLYRVYALFWSFADNVTHWGIQATISGGTLLSYDDRNATDTGILAGPSSPVHLFEVQLPGLVSGTSVAIDVKNAVTVDVQRSWYEGLAYDAVPEPGAAGTMMLLGASALLARKRS
jgi:hypothetical protein